MEAVRADMFLEKSIDGEYYVCDIDKSIISKVNEKQKNKTICK